MNGVQVVILILCALTGLSLYLSHQHIMLEARVAELTKPGALCAAFGQCSIVQEPFAVQSMDECIRILKEGRQCLMDKSSDPMMCYPLLVQGEKCLAGTLNRMEGTVQPPPLPVVSPVVEEPVPVLDLTGITLDSDPLVIEPSMLY